MEKDSQLAEKDKLIKNLQKELKKAKDDEIELAKNNDGIFNNLTNKSIDLKTKLEK